MIGIAQKKKAENIAEYVLYMWQMEDLLRGMNFDLTELENSLLASIPDDKTRDANRIWFKKLSEDMAQESVTISGHQHDSMQVVNALVFLQNKLLSIGSNPAFQEAYKAAKPVLEEFKSKAEKIPMNEVETAFTALYGMLTLRISGKEISPETRAGIQTISKYIALLSQAYHAEQN